MIFTKIVDSLEMPATGGYGQTEVITGTLWVIGLPSTGLYGFAEYSIYQGDGSGAATDYPAETDVRDGVAYGSGTLLGNMTEPAESDVRSGVDYGANGTEFTGTLAGGGESFYAFFS